MITLKVLIVLLFLRLAGSAEFEMIPTYTTQETFEWFIGRIAEVESSNRHWINGSVITNHKGCVGENQIHPETAQFIIDVYKIDGHRDDISDLNTNRWFRNLLIVYYRTNDKMTWRQVANAYNMGRNSKRVNTNYLRRIFCER